MTCLGKLIISLILLEFVLAYDGKIDRRHAKCLVCHRVVEELFKEIDDVGSPLKHGTGSRRNAMDDSQAITPVKKRKSEMYFDDLMDRLCKKMGEYVRVISKSSGQLELIPLIINGKMNADLSLYDIIKDGDIESVEFYCESIISEYEEQMLQLFKDGVSSEKYIKDICLNSEICKLPGSVPLFNDEL